MKTASFLFLLGCASLHGATPQDQAANAINQFGLDLYRAESATLSGNILFSPYSLQNALAMAYAGADGDTHKEMQRVLHYASDDEGVNRGFAALNDNLASIVQHSKKAHASDASGETSPDSPSTPIEVESANKLFLQSGWQIEAPFISVVKQYYGTEPESHDFRENPKAGREAINQWVKKQTHDRIQDIIPDGVLGQDTRLVLANALYFRAGWQEQFSHEGTELRDFFVNGRNKQFVSTMRESLKLGYRKSHGLTVVTVPYEGRKIQFLIIMPDDPASFARTEKSISASDLAEWSRLKPQSVILYLPRFKLEPDVMALRKELIQLGLKTAFDQPKVRLPNLDPRLPHLGNARLALQVPHLFFKRTLEVRRCLAELRHQFSQRPGQFRQLLWAKYHQHHQKHHNHVRYAEHR